jgi:hypothetical protein
MQYGSTSIVSKNDVAAIRHSQTDVDVGVGQIRETTVRTYVSSNYAARYNFAVKNYKYVDQDESDIKMRNMRGGHFFLFNIIVGVFFCGSVYCIYNINDSKPLVGVPIATSIIYLLITCYNWHIYRTNDNVLHDCMIEVKPYYLSGWMNRFFKIPIHARIQNQELIAASDGSTTAVLARLQQRYYNLTEITIMLYCPKYRAVYATFPSATIVHFILFLGTLVGAIYQLLMSLNQN